MRLFVELATERLARWIDLAESSLAGTGIRCYATGGNDDLTEVMATMDRPDTQAFVACEDRAVPIDDEHVDGQHAVRQPDALEYAARGGGAGAGRADRGGRRRDRPTTGR